MSTYMEAERKNRELHDYTIELKRKNAKKGRYVCKGCQLMDIAPCDKNGNCNFEGCVTPAYEKIFGKESG